MKHSISTAFSGDWLSLARLLEIDYESLENIVEEGENAAYQYFILFPIFYPFNDKI